MPDEKWIKLEYPAGYRTIFALLSERNAVIEQLKDSFGLTPISEEKFEMIVLKFGESKYASPKYVKLSHPAGSARVPIDQYERVREAFMNSPSNSIMIGDTILLVPHYWLHDVKPQFVSEETGESVKMARAQYEVDIIKAGATAYVPLKVTPEA